MSTFGDGNPKEELLDQCKYIASEHNLTLAQFVAAISEVVAYLAESSEYYFAKEEPKS